MNSRLVTRARVEGLVILLVAVAYILETQRIPALFQSPGVPGPAAFPTVLGAVLGLVGLWRLVRGVPGEAPRKREEPPESEKPSWWLAHGRFYALWAVLLGFLVFLPELGFPVAAFLALVAMFRLLDEKRWLLIVPLSVLVTAVLYVAFADGLGVRLPLGLAQGILGR